MAKSDSEVVAIAALRERVRSAVKTARHLSAATGLSVARTGLDWVADILEHGAAGVDEPALDSVQPDERIVGAG